MEEVEQAYEQELRSQEGGQSGLDGEQGLAQIERVQQSVRSEVEQFESREEALRERFQQAIE